MKGCTRRSFCLNVAGLAAGAAVAGGEQKAEAAKKSNTPPPSPPIVELGKTGIKLSRVGQGTGMHGYRRQSNHTRMGFEKLVALFRHGYERGLRFFDLADYYGTHVYFREALRFIPRDEVAILTKIWWREDGPTKPKAEPYRKRVAATTIERFLQEIATDHIDILLLHCLTSKNWETELEPYMKAMDDAKRKGKVRAVGVSCHKLEALERAVDSDWVDVILARLNPYGVKMDGPTEQIVKVLKRARKNGKAIIGMKILGEGKLADHKEECFKFAQENQLLDCMTIGFEKPQEIDEALSILGKYPVKPLV